MARDCGADALPIVGDAAQRAEVRGAVEATLARFCRIDVWINNVGQGISRPPSQLTDEDIDEVIRLNVKCALYGMQEVLPHFKQQGEGHVINLSSMLGRIPFAVIRSAYVGAKHACAVSNCTTALHLALLAVGVEGPHVSPPSVDVFISMRLPAPLLSHSM